MAYMKRFLKNVAWLQAANLVSLIVAFLVTYAYFLKEDVLGREFFAFFIGIFIVFETFKLIFSWDPADILVKELAGNKFNHEEKNSLAHQGFCFALTFAALTTVAIFLSAEFVIDFFFQNWLDKISDSTHVRNTVIKAVLWTAPLPLFHSVYVWGINLLQAKERMKASSILLVAANLSRPLGALLGLFYAKNILGLSSPVDFFPYMVQGVLVAYSISLLPCLLLVNKHYKGLASLILSFSWPRLESKIARRVFEFSSSKKIIGLYNRFPLWLAPAYMSPETFTLMIIALKIFEVSKQPFSPVSKTLLPHLAAVHAEGRFKYLKSQIARVNFWGSLTGLGLSLITTLGALYVVLPHLMSLSAEEIQLISESALPLLACYLFIGVSVTNGIVFIILDMTKLFLKLSLFIIPIAALAAYLLISEHGFLGVCYYTLFYHCLFNMVNKYFAHKKLMAVG
jgi:O-antigen/teichoic acid export membrane protein